MSQTAMALPTTMTGLKADAVKYHALWQRQSARMKSFAKENEKRIEGIVGVVEVVGIAALIGYLNGKQVAKTGTPVMIGAYDADMLIGAGVGALALAEMGGKFNEQLYLASAGLLASYASRAAWTKGQTPVAAATPAAAAPAAAVAGVAAAGMYR
jgi:hypothetical protein